MKKFLRGWVVNGLSLWVIDLLMDSISFGDGGALLATALLLTLLNMTLKPLLKEGFECSDPVFDLRAERLGVEDFVRLTNLLGQ